MGIRKLMVFQLDPLSRGSALGSRSGIVTLHLLDYTLAATAIPTPARVCMLRSLVLTPDYEG